MGRTWVNPVTATAAHERMPVPGRREKIDASAALTGRLLAGDTAALTELYESHFDSMLALIQHMTGRDEAFSLDCAQDAWMRIARKPVYCPDRGRLSAWIRRVALSAALDRLRSDAARRIRERHYARERGAATDDLAAIDALHQAIRDAVASAGPVDQALIQLRYGASLTLSQIGSLLGLETAAVESRLRRLAARLRESVEEVK